MDEDEVKFIIEVYTYMIIFAGVLAMIVYIVDAIIK